MIKGTNSKRNATIPFPNAFHFFIVLEDSHLASIVVELGTGLGVKRLQGLFQGLGKDSGAARLEMATPRQGTHSR